MASARKEHSAGLSKGIKLTKAERKMAKKQNKALHTLKNREKEVGEISDFPTAYLLVKNGGLMCGVERQDLANVFKKYGKLDDLIMLPGKSYSYVLYCSPTGAEGAMASLNGQKLCFNQKVFRTFYLAYLKRRPYTELCLSNKDYPVGMILIEEFINELQELELLQCFSGCKERTAITGINWFFTFAASIAAMMHSMLTVCQSYTKFCDKNMLTPCRRYLAYICNSMPKIFGVGYMECTLALQLSEELIVALSLIA